MAATEVGLGGVPGRSERTRMRRTRIGGGVERERGGIWVVVAVVGVRVCL